MEKSLKKGTAKEKVQKTISGWFGGIVKNKDNDKILEENKRKKVERDGAVDTVQQVQRSKGWHFSRPSWTRKQLHLFEVKSNSY